MRILLAGYYGFGNLGDELLAETTADLLGQQHKITILKKRSAFWSAIKKNDCLLFAGGSLFQDVTGFGLSLLYYAGMGFVAKILGKKLFLLGQGIGPIICHFDRFVLRLLLKQADFISVRDADSALLLRRMGCKNFQIGTDLLFSVPAVLEGTVWREREPQPPNKQKSLRPPQRVKKIIANLRPFRKFQPKQGVKTLKKFTPFYVPMQNKVDYGQALSEKQILQAIAGAKLAVGMRLHFLILAVLFNVPAVGIAYDPKVSSFCRKFKLPYVEMDNLSVLPKVISKELSRLNLTKKKLLPLVRQEKQLAAKSLTALREALNA